jgi:hypothetical protein
MAFQKEYLFYQAVFFYEILKFIASLYVFTEIGTTKCSSSAVMHGSAPAWKGYLVVLVLVYNPSHALFTL